MFLVGLISSAWAAQTPPTQAQPVWGAPEGGEDEGEPSTEPEVAAVPVAPEVDPASDEEVAARLTAWNIAAEARFMALVEGVAQRQADGARGVVVGLIHEEIELGIAYYTDRVIEHAEETNAALLVFEIETWGGRVDAAVMMKDAILRTEIPTVAFINKRAISAGALIALANDLIIVADGATIGAATPIQMGGPGGQAQPVEEKIVSALRSEFRATAEANGRSGAVAETMVDANLAVAGVIEGGKLLTMTGGEAREVGLVEGRSDTLDSLLETFGLEDATVTTMTESWSETLVRFLTSSTISGLLMTLGMLGLFFELMSPGFGWAGMLGIICLTFFFAGHLLVHLAGLEEVLLFAAGILLLLVEVFVLPGFGVAGVLGLVAIMASLAMALINLDIDITFSPTGLSGALTRVVLSLIATFLLIGLLLKYVPRTRVGRRLVLQEALATGASVDDGSDDLAVGMTGRATADLKPFGKARFGQQPVEVVAESGYIDRGAHVRISRIAGGRIEVRSFAPVAPDEVGDDTPAAEGDDSNG